MSQKKKKNMTAHFSFMPLLPCMFPLLKFQSWLCAALAIGRTSHLSSLAQCIRYIVSGWIGYMSNNASLPQSSTSDGLSSLHWRWASGHYLAVTLTQALLAFHLRHSVSLNISRKRLVFQISVNIWVLIVPYTVQKSGQVLPSSGMSRIMELI
jgi:hypothetical protein